MIDDWFGFAVFGWVMGGCSPHGSASRRQAKTNKPINHEQQRKKFVSEVNSWNERMKLIELILINLIEFLPQWNE